jgi:DNA-binding NarL/FixJ family response regulator/nucleoside phosphorylase
MANEQSHGRALVVDDDPLVRTAVTRLLIDAGYDVSEARRGEEAVELAASLRPDVILMDVVMRSSISGIEATRRIVERDPNARVMMLSIHDSGEVVAAALEAGATSYVTKDTPLPTLLDAVARTAVGQRVLIPAPATTASDLKLTAREQKVLDLTVSGLTARQIGERLSLSPRTVEHHLQSAYARLGVTSRAQLMHAASDRESTGGAPEAAADMGLAQQLQNLTDAERQVAGLVGLALTNQQIADRLHLSRHTVNYHLRRIFQKLGISSRVQLARIAAGSVATAGHSGESGGVTTSPTVVILTALDREFDAVRAHLVEPEPYTPPAGTVFDVGRTSSGADMRVALAVVGSGTAGAAVVAEQAIAEFAPVAVLFVGVAGALRDHIELGDVVVATKVYGLHGSREEAGQFHARPDAWPAPYRLEQVARHVDRADVWTSQLELNDRRQPSVHFRPIASGEIVLNSRITPLARQLDKLYSDAVAIETESAGAAKASHLRDVPMLTIRGISYKADGGKGPADRAGWRDIAAANAAAFAAALVKSLGGE